MPAKRKPLTTTSTLHESATQPYTYATWLAGPIISRDRADRSSIVPFPREIRTLLFERTRIHVSTDSKLIFNPRKLESLEIRGADFIIGEWNCLFQYNESVYVSFQLFLKFFANDGHPILIILIFGMLLPILLFNYFNVWYIINVLTIKNYIGMKVINSNI